MKRVYAILDTASDMLFGGLHLFPSDTPAIRFFGDIASDQQTMIARHPKDFALVCIAEQITDDGVIPARSLEQSPRVVITGEQWLAAQNPGEQLALKVS